MDNLDEADLKQIAENYSSWLITEGVTVNYLEMARKLLVQYHDSGNISPEAVKEAVAYNRQIISTLLQVAEEKIGHRYIPSLRHTLENKLAELDRVKAK